MNSFIRRQPAGQRNFFVFPFLQPRRGFFVLFWLELAHYICRMIVTGLKNYVYASNYGDITVSGLADSVAVVLQVEGNTVLEERYYPDADGKAVIHNIGDVLLAYFAPPADASLGDSRRKLFLNVSIRIGSSFSHGQTVFYSNIKNDIEIDFAFAKFLTRYQKKKTSVSRCEFLSFYDNSQSIYLGIAYLHEGQPQFLRFKWQDCGNTHEGVSLNVSLSKMPAMVGERTAHSITAADIVYYEAYSVVGEEVVSEIRYINDRRFFPQEKHMLYYNCFGLPETITFRGVDKRSVEPNAVYATMQDEYRKVDARPVIYDEVNSGYINPVEADCIEELLVSDYVYLYGTTGIDKKIVFTDVGMEKRKPDNVPVNYTLTYRPAALKCLEYKSIIYNAGRIFDKTFDYTFE